MHQVNGLYQKAYYNRNITNLGPRMVILRFVNDYSVFEQIFMCRFSSFLEVSFSIIDFIGRSSLLKH